MEVVISPPMAVVPLPPLSAPALSHSYTKANVTFVGGLLFPKMKISWYREVGASEAARGGNALLDPAAAACSDIWVYPSLGCRVSWLGWLGQAAVLSGNSYFCHRCTDFQVFPALCMGVHVDTLQWATSKQSCPVVRWCGAGFI